MPDNRLTRRAALTLVSSAAAVAQRTESPATDDLMEARESMKVNRDQLRKIEIPVATEPSFVFRP